MKLIIWQASISYCIVLWTLLHSFIAFLVLLSWLYNLAFWLQFLINLLTDLLILEMHEYKHAMITDDRY